MHHTGGAVDAHFAGFEIGEAPNYRTLFRQYSGSMGRWLSPDPLAGDISNPQSLNRYAYALNNPTTLIDPTGLDTMRLRPPSCGGMVCADNPATYGGLPYPGYQNIGAPDPFDLQLYTTCNSEGCGTGLDFNGATLANWLATVQPPQPGNTPPPATTKPPAIPPAPNQTQSPAQGATRYCQEHGELSFRVPFTQVPVTIAFSATAFFNFSSTNDIAITIPPAAGASIDITVGAPSGPNIPVQIGAGKNLSVGTFFTPSGVKGFNASFGPSIGAPMTFSPTVTNACGVNAGGG